MLLRVRAQNPTLQFGMIGMDACSFLHGYANPSRSASLPPLKTGIMGLGMQAIIYSKQCLCLLTSLPVHTLPMAFGIRPTRPELRAAVKSCDLGCTVRRDKIGKKDKDSEVPQDHSAHKSFCLVPGPVHRTIDLEDLCKCVLFPLQNVTFMIRLK